MGILGRLLGGSKKSGPAPESREEADRLIARGQQSEDSGDFAAAEARYREAIAAAPSYPRAHINLGNALHKLGRLEDAAASHRAALDFDPDYAGAHFNLGTVLVQLGDNTLAKRHLERALEKNPAMTDAAIMLATACEAEQDLPGARAQLERALSIDPRHAGAAANLGTVLVEMGEIGAAEESFRESLRFDPDCAQALAGLARIDVQRGCAREAEAAFRAALQKNPGDTLVWSSFLFSLNLRDDLDAQSVAREHFAFGELFAGGARVPVPRNSPRSRIRVGYVSGDLMKHPVALFLRPVLASHDRAQFETFCYSNSRQEDELTVELRKTSDHWRSIAGREDPWVEALIRADEIDVLVDLSGHTAGNRLAVFALRPAPVQATWLGYLNTTGLQAMDFRICDRHTDPEGATEAFNTESLARLPHSQWCYSPYYDLPLKALPAAGSRPVTFGSFNQFAKVSDACLDLWAAILREVPESCLRVYGVPAGEAAERFHARLEQRGVPRQRATLHGRAGILDFFAAIEDVDIALDSMPYNGATTTLDTLWMGVPVVALRGTRAIGRGTCSIASAAGFTELVTETPAEYVERNIHLARDSRARIALRHSLRPKLQSSPLMDTGRFTRDLEALYRKMLAAR
jgi:predicted O-linked N-acetylglucosamine transferase (SPINDLY family)